MTSSDDLNAVADNTAKKLISDYPQKRFKVILIGVFCFFVATQVFQTLQIDKLQEEIKILQQTINK